MKKVLLGFVIGLGLTAFIAAADTVTVNLSAQNQFSGGITNASGTHIGAEYSELVSQVSNEGDFTSIQAAVNADCANASPGKIFVKAGTYTSFQVPSTCSGIQIIGESESSTVISNTASTTVVNFGDLNGSLHDSMIENMTISCGGVSRIGLNLQRIQVSFVQNLYITQCSTAATTTALQGTGLILDGGGTLLADNFISNVHEDHDDLDLLIASTSNANQILGLDLYGQNNASSALIRLQNGVGNTIIATNLSSATTGLDCRTQKNIVFMGNVKIIQ
jgi:hypothetical protein